MPSGFTSGTLTNTDALTSTQNKVSDKNYEISNLAVVETGS